MKLVLINDTFAPKGPTDYVWELYVILTQYISKSMLSHGPLIQQRRLLLPTHTHLNRTHFMSYEVCSYSRFSPGPSGEARAGSIISVENVDLSSCRPGRYH